VYIINGGMELNKIDHNIIELIDMSPKIAICKFEGNVVDISNPIAFPDLVNS
jgi:hypothetical protein